MGLEEFTNPKAPCIAPRLMRRQRVVGPDHLIAIGDIGTRAQKQRAIAGHVFQEPVITVRHDLHMLRRDIIRHLQHLVVGITDDHLAVFLPACLGCGRSRENLEQPVNLGQSILGQLTRIGQQNGRRVIAVFRLPQEIGRAQLGIRCCLIRDNHRLGRAGEEINTHPSVKLTLGLGDEGIAGANQHVYRIDRLCAKRHSPNRLDPAHDIDFICPAQMHRRNNSRVWFSVKGRRAGHDAWYFGNLGRGDRHMRAGDHGEFPARNVAADGLNRDILVPQNNPRKRLYFDVGHRSALRAGKIHDLLLRKLNVLQFPCAELTDQVVNLLLA